LRPPLPCWLEAGVENLASLKMYYIQWNIDVRITRYKNKNQRNKAAFHIFITVESSVRKRASISIVIFGSFLI